MEFVELFQGKVKRGQLEEQYESTAGVRYQQIKEELAEAIHKYFEPFKNKRKEFEENPGLVDSILEESIEECSKLAEETMIEVREKMGLV